MSAEKKSQTTWTAEEGTLTPLFIVHEYCVKNKVDWTCGGGGTSKDKVWIKLGSDAKRVHAKTVRECAVKVLKSNKDILPTEQKGGDSVAAWFDSRQMSRPAYKFAPIDGSNKWTATMSHSMVQDTFTAKATTKAAAQAAVDCAFLKVPDKERIVRMWRGLESYYRQLTWLCGGFSPAENMKKTHLASEYMSEVVTTTVNETDDNADRKIASWLLKFGELGYDEGKGGTSTQHRCIPDSKSKTVFGFGVCYVDQKRQDVSSILLATCSGCLIYNCQTSKSLPPMLTLLLEAGHVFKPGFNAEVDRQLLQKRFGVHVDGMIDMNQFAEIIGWSAAVGFSRMVALFCQRYYKGTPRLFFGNGQHRDQILDVVLVHRVVSLAVLCEQTTEHLIDVSEDAKRLEEKLFEIHKKYTTDIANAPVATCRKRSTVSFKRPTGIASLTVTPRIGFDTFLSHLPQAIERGGESVGCILNHVIAESDL
jgi:hypothetical protein